MVASSRHRFGQPPPGGITRRFAKSEVRHFGQATFLTLRADFTKEIGSPTQEKRGSAGQKSEAEPHELFSVPLTVSEIDRTEETIGNRVAIR